jgi:hypothetical protein
MADMYINRVNSAHNICTLLNQLYHKPLKNYQESKFISVH